MGELSWTTRSTPGTTPTWSISHVATETGLSISTLRYYEKARLLTVPRSSAGQRRYGQAEVDAVKFIDQLRRTGMPIRGIREYADLVRAGEDTTELRMQRLEEHRGVVSAHVAQQQRHLEAITQKIDAYRRMLADQHKPDSTAPLRDARGCVSTVAASIPALRPHSHDVETGRTGTSRESDGTAD